MIAPIIQCKYDTLEQLARIFEAQSNAVNQIIVNLRAAMEPLRAGGWIGLAAERFFAEMEQELLPRTYRLAEALEEAAVVTRMISETMRVAEEEASALFQQANVMSLPHAHLSIPKQGGIDAQERVGPPPVPVPGAPPGTIWRPVPPTAPDRRTKWVPRPPIKGQSQPSASWDPDGHWDVEDGFGERRRYDKEGNPLTPDQAHDPSDSTPSNQSSIHSQLGPTTISEDTLRKIGQITGLTGTALIVYIIVSEGLRILFPPRNLIPLP
ncbi:MAG: WXG100 family type VII secretion target [Anaerolineales bacterium]|nr:WXG100 family type VII secretion target [Anaerolineales bacterium]